jgi:hypothetical protein
VILEKMSFNFRRSPKESSPQLQSGEKNARRVRSSSDGDSPRRRWSPVKLSPSLRMRPKKYAHLKLSPTDPSDENPFKENESPLGTLSVDSIPNPTLPSRIRQGTPPPSINFSLPPPSPSARRTRTPIRSSNNSRFSSGSYDSRNIKEGYPRREQRSSPSAGGNPVRGSNHYRFSAGSYDTRNINEDESRHEQRSSPSSRQTPVRGSNHYHLSAASYDSRNTNEESKREQPSSTNAGVSPIFRLNVQPRSSGIETMLPNEYNTAKLADTASKLNIEKPDHDDFAELVNSRQESARLNPSGKASTDLHELCYSLCTLDDVTRAQSYLIRHTTENDTIADCVSNTDHKGRTPIHAFSENKVLATAVGIPDDFDYETREYVKLYQQPTFDPESNLEKHVVRFLISDLLAAYPGAMMRRDRDGCIPFESALTEWVSQSRHNCQNSNEPETGYLSNLASYTNSVSRAWGSTSTTILSAVKLGARRGTRVAGDPIPGVMPTSPINPGAPGSGNSFDWNDPIEDLVRDGNEGSVRSSDRMKSSIVAHSVRLTPHARFALMMLSAIVDQLDHYMSPELFRLRSSRVRNKLGCASQDEFERVLKRVRTFRDIYGSVDISSAVVQSGK